MTVFEFIFVLSAVAFNLLIAALFIAQKLGGDKLVRIFGVLWLCLSIPFALVFVSYWLDGHDPRILVIFGFVFLYMLVEFLLDYVFKVDFRAKAILHVPYIILEYAALLSLIVIAFDIDRGWGWVVTVCFWILMGSLVYLYWDKIFRKRSSHEN
jgi:hypothetical protein